MVQFRVLTLSFFSHFTWPELILYVTDTVSLIGFTHGQLYIESATQSNHILIPQLMTAMLMPLSNPNIRQKCYKPPPPPLH